QLPPPPQSVQTNAPKATRQRVPQATSKRTSTDPGSCCDPSIQVFEQLLSLSPSEPLGVSQKIPLIGQISLLFRMQDTKKVIRLRKCKLAMHQRQHRHQ